jgi:ubiquinone/menaquinone biosynthesis C-methylase UbiE
MNTSRPAGAADPRVAFFDQLAPRWDKECSHPDEIIRRLTELNGSLGLAPGRDLLEVGCGTGQLTAWLANTVAPGRVVAVDFSPGMLAQARQRNPPAEFRLLDICSDEPLTDRFDVVLCFNAFPHFRDKPAALRRIARGLKPGGRLLIVHLVGRAELNAFHQKLSGPVCRDLLPSPDEWPDLLGAAGLGLASLTDQSGLFLLKAAPY